MSSVVAARAWREQQFRANMALAREKQDVVLWAETAWAIRGDRTQPYSIEKYPYLIEIANSKARRVVVMSCAGGGKTEIFLNFALAHADWGKRVLYTFETNQKAGHIVQERVNPNIKSSPYFYERCKDVDNIVLKKFGSGIVYFFGLGGEGATSTYHGDILVRDEKGKMNQQHATLVQKRLESSTDPLIRDISNPDFPRMNIHQDFLDGDQRRWYVPCGHCGHEQALDFFTFVNQQTGDVLCPKCKRDFDRLAPGHWVVGNPGAPYPSYHVIGMMNPSFNILNTLKELKDPRPDVLEAVHRMSLGVPYETAESGLSAEDLKGAEHGDQWTKVAPGGFMTVDPGGVFDVQIYQKPDRYGTAVCTWAGTVQNWQELHALADESQVAGGVIDFQPELKAAEEFAERRRHKGQIFWRCAYTIQGEAGPKFDFDNEQPGIVKVNRTRMADEMVGLVRGRKLRFTKRLALDETGRWFEHMRSPKRVSAPGAGGIMKTRWEHEESRPDHQFHCTLYGTVWLCIHGTDQQGGSSEVLEPGW